ncbi:MAG: CD0415/CD1112 family protein [Eubacteriales bacterium]
MEAIKEALTEWFESLFQEVLIHGICGSLYETFGVINNKVGEIAENVAKSPSEWNGGIFALVQNLSETVMLPIAGLILTYVMVYELISMIMDKNNFHDFPPSDIMKWIFKTYMSVVLVTNVFDITMAVFDVAKHVVNSSSSIITADTSVDPFESHDVLWAALESHSLGELLQIYVQSLLIGISIQIIGILITVVIYGRMIEIYLLTSLAPIPFATLMNKEQASIGQNYFKVLLAIGFQGFLIMVCVGIYAVLIQGIGLTLEPNNVLRAMWECLGYSILLCFTLFKSASISKSIFNAH